MKILVLHPGTMGFTVASALQENGHQVFWCSEGRSAETLERASSLSLTDLKNVSEAIRHVDAVVSICMGGGVLPNALEAVRAGFSGVFIDLNYVGGENEIADLARILEQGSVRYVEGAIYGWPLSSFHGTYEERIIYLGGPNSSPEDTALFSEVIDGSIFKVNIVNESAKLVKQRRNEQESATSVPHTNWGFGVVEFPNIAHNIDDGFIDEWLERRRLVEPSDYVVDDEGMYVSRGGYKFTPRQIESAPERYMNLSPSDGSAEDKEFHEQIKQAMLWCIQAYTGIYPESKDAVWWGADGHVAVYKPGSSMGVHHDNAIGQASGNENPAFLTVSGSLILSDRCLGGDLYFKHLNKSFKPQKGTAILYPSGFMGAHAVSPIEDGVRISYLEFFGHGNKAGTSRRV